MADAEIFDMDAFRKQEEGVVSERLEHDEQPELRGVSEDTIKERLVELGKGAILTTRLAAELGEEVDPKILQAVTQIRNMTMRTLGFISPDQAKQALSWATEEWEEIMKSPLDSFGMSADLTERAQRKVSEQKGK